MQGTNGIENLLESGGTGDRLSVTYQADFSLLALVLALLLPIHLLVLAANQSSFLWLDATLLAAVLAISLRMQLKDAGWLFVASVFIASCFQNIFLGGLLNLQPDPVVFPMLVLIETKTALLFGGFAICALLELRRWEIKEVNFDWGGTCALLFAAALLLSFCFSPASLFSKAAQTRNLATPFAAWYLGKWCIRDPKNLRKLLAVLMAAGIVLSFFSAAELLTKNFWGDYLQKDTLLDLKGPTADTTDLLWIEVSRLYTGIGSPINAAYIFSLLFIIALFMRRKFLACIFGGQALLTFAKAGIMVGLVGALVFIFRRTIASYRSWWRLAWVAPLAIFLVGAYLYAAGTQVSDIADASQSELSNTAVGHLRGLVGAVTQLPSAPFGNGLGVGGDMSEVTDVIGMGDKQNPDLEHRYEMGGESTIGVIIYQLGFIGVISFLGWCASRVRELFLVFRHLAMFHPTYSQLALGLLAALTAVVMSAFGSESAIVPQTGGSVFLLAGALCGSAATISSGYSIKQAASL